jgi:hypothetical protein
MKKLIILFTFTAFFLPKNSYSAIDPKEQMKVIAFSGLGGAALGLSTLSFYDEPQDHLRNIAIGGAIGLIGAVVFSTVMATKNNKKSDEDKTDTTDEQPKNMKIKDNKDKEKDKSEEDSFNMHEPNKTEIKILFANLTKHELDLMNTTTFAFNPNKNSFFVNTKLIEINF